MKFLKICILSVIFILLFLTHSGQKLKASTEKRESILDRVVSIEPELIKEIPQVPRWCDRLDLIKERIDVGDAKLYVEEEGKGLPLVLINGGPGGTHHYFHPWFSRLKDDNIRIIYYDQRGCGLSDFKPGKDGYNVTQAISDLDAIRKAKGIEKWVVLGYSYGGFLAQYYTVTYPEHVAGLILLGSSPTGDGDFGSRQHMFLSDKEEARLKEIREEVRQLRKKEKMSREKAIQILIYNNTLNGDWKRQHFYKPSKERIAQTALYEWVNDINFNSIMNESESFWDFTGAFDQNPIPTLILEGKWDLTWGENKHKDMQRNHPKAKMVVFEQAGHGIYDEDTEHFFKVLKEFLLHLPAVPESKIKAYKEFLVTWQKKIEKKKKESPSYFLKLLGWGFNSSKKIVASYSPDWVAKFKQTGDFLHVGFAFYDLSKYPEALKVFEEMEKFAKQKGDLPDQAVSLIWQGHMLDLMKKRDQAITRYKKASQMNINYSISHNQYDNLHCRIPSYALERMKTPFKRIENNLKD